jgi:hypothetical protein
MREWGGAEPRPEADVDPILVFTILIGTRDGPRCAVHNIRYDQDEAAVGLGAGSLPPEVPEIPVAGFGWVKPSCAQVG